MTLLPRDLHFGDTQLGVAFLMPAPVTLGRSTSLEAIETTRLLYGFYVDESSACYV